MAHSARRMVLLLGSFIMVLPGERKKPSRISWTIEISPSTRWFFLGRSPASFWVSHSTTYCVRLSLILCRPLVHTARCCARQRVRCSRSLKILTAREPMSLFSHRLLLLLVLHQITLLSERKNLIWIAREIKIFTIFTWSVLTWVPKHYSSLSFPQQNLTIVIFSTVFTLFLRRVCKVVLGLPMGLHQIVWAFLAQLLQNLNEFLLAMWEDDSLAVAR